MSYDHGSRENRRRAARLLLVLKGRLVGATEAVEQPVTMQGATSSSHWRLFNLAGVHVYHERAGWHADLAFKALPTGVPPLIGSAVPLRSHPEVLRSAIRQLSMCAEREKIPLPSDNLRIRWFMFDEVEVSVEYDYLPEVITSLGRQGYTAEEAKGRLAYLRHLVCEDEPLTADMLKAADPDLRTPVYVACEIAMALGLT